MSHTTYADYPDFTLIESEEDHQQILAYARKHRRTLDRLFDALSNKPGRIEDTRYIFDKVIYLTVDADRLLMSWEPKHESDGYGIIVAVRSREAAAGGAMAMLIATTIGCMRIRDGVRACNLLKESGQDADVTLYRMGMESIAQMEAASRDLLDRLTMH